MKKKKEIPGLYAPHFWFDRTHYGLSVHNNNSNTNNKIKKIKLKWKKIWFWTEPTSPALLAASTAVSKNFASESKIQKNLVNNKESVLITKCEIFWKRRIKEKEEYGALPFCAIWVYFLLYRIKKLKRRTRREGTASWWVMMVVMTGCASFLSYFLFIWFFFFCIRSKMKPSNQSNPTPQFYLVFVCVFIDKIHHVTQLPFNAHTWKNTEEFSPVPSR